MASTKKRSRRRASIVIPRPRLAASPGTIDPPPSAATPKIHVIAYGAEQIEERDVDGVASLKELRNKTPGVLWVNIEGVGDAATFKELGELFGLHSLALEDVVHPHQRPKLENYDDHTFVVFHIPKGDDTAAIEQMSIFFSKDYVITVKEGDPVDCLEPLRQRIRGARGRIRKRGADYLAYAVMDGIVDSYFPVVERLNGRLELLEEQVVQLAGDEVVTEIHTVRHDLHILRRVLASSREVLGLLMRDEIEIVSESTVPFLRDCHDHTEQLLDAVEVLRELVAGLMDLHLAGMSHRMNEAMRVLTVIATIFIPLSFIAGLYGMNFDRMVSPWNMPELGWVLGYPFALAIMLATSIGFLIYFRHRGWLGKTRKKAAQNEREETTK